MKAHEASISQTEAWRKQTTALRTKCLQSIYKIPAKPCR